MREFWESADVARKLGCTVLVIMLMVAAFIMGAVHTVLDAKVYAGTSETVYIRVLGNDFVHQAASLLER